jgi:hypothetical protein
MAGVSMRGSRTLRYVLLIGMVLCLVVAVAWCLNRRFTLVWVKSGRVIGLMGGGAILEYDDPLSRYLPDGFYRFREADGQAARRWPRIEWSLPANAAERFVSIKTVFVPFWLLLIIFAVPPSLAFVRGPLRRWWRLRNSRCLLCGYNLTGNVSGRCPECGTVIASNEADG